MYFSFTKSHKNSNESKMYKTEFYVYQHTAYFNGSQILLKYFFNRLLSTAVGFYSQVSDILLVSFILFVFLKREQFPLEYFPYALDTRKTIHYH